MATHTQKDDVLVLKFGAVDYAAQVIDAQLDPPGYGTPTATPVASDLSKVSEPGEPENGTLSGTVFKDTTSTGISYILAQARVAGTKLTYEFTDNNGTDDIKYAGDCYVASVPNDFQPDKLGRHTFSLTLTTCTITSPL